MSILSISRNFNGNPNIVTVVTDNTISEIIAPGYWQLPAIVDSIAALQNGVWEWADTDLVLINYSPASNGYFTFDAVNQAFVINTPNQHPVPFTPTISFVTPGDLTVVYNVQVGFYWQVGNLILLRSRVAFTPTYTTSSGALVMPHPFFTLVNGTVGGSFFPGLPIAFPAGTTQITPLPFASTTETELRAFGSGVNPVSLSTTEFPSGTAQDFTVFAVFQI